MATTRGDGGGRASKRKGGGGLDIGKFASEVSRNYAKGVAQVGKALDVHVPSRKASSTVTSAMRNAPKARAALKKATGKR